MARASVGFDRLREGALALSRIEEGDREPIVVDALPPWLTATELRVGDRILGVIERGQRRDTSDLDGMRRALGVGGTFVVLRAGREREVRVPLAPGCDEPGRGQPSTCAPR